MIQNQVQDRQNEREWLSWICESKTTEELRIKYDQWASNYDIDVEKHWRFIPDCAALTLEKVLPMKNANILDAGTGTGILGEALVKLGYTNITAADLSEEMLAVAKKKQVYKALIQCNLENPQVFAEEMFDGILATGVFAHAHAGVTVLQNLFRFLKREGVFLLTIRENYRNEMQEAFEQFPWSLVSQEQFRIYEQEVIYILVFRKERSR